MDNSLIPRPFSPTDAKRRAEENAREAERRSSARNASSSTIGAGGTLDLHGNITVSGGGNIDVLDQGAVIVTSAVQGPSDQQYTVAAELGNVNGGLPGLKFTSTAQGGGSATLQSDDGVGLVGRATTSVAESSFKVDGSTSPNVIMSTSGYSGQAVAGYGEISATPGTFLLKANDQDGNSLARVAATANGKMVLSSAAGIDIQGTLTNNGSPISGGAGAVSSVAGKTGAVTLVKADVGLSNVDNTSDANKPVSTATRTALDYLTGGGGRNIPPLVVTTLITADIPAIAENDTVIVWNSVDGDAAMNPTANKSRLVAPVAGLYFLSGNVTFSNVGGGMRGVWFRKNGTVRLRGQSNPPPSAAQFAEIDAHNFVRLAANDYIEVMATVAGASGAVTIKADNGTAAAMEWRRP